MSTIPNQPDGLDDHYEDDSDLPNPHRAAERVNAWVAAWGDGLINVTDGHPLYARDLEAIARIVAEVDRLRAELAAAQTVVFAARAWRDHQGTTIDLAATLDRLRTARDLVDAKAVTR